jgi:hypothetical protein
MSDCIGTPVSITPIHTPVHSNGSPWEGMPLVSYRPPIEVEKDLREIIVPPPQGWIYNVTVQSVDHHTLHMYGPHGHRIPVTIDTSRGDIQILSQDRRIFEGDNALAMSSFFATYGHKQAMWAWHGIEPK